MSKTYAIQVEKSRTLLAGLRKNLEAASNLGITKEELDKLEKDSEEADRMNTELDVLRAEVSEKASVANKKLTEVRTQVQSMKSLIKKKVDQAQWESYGIPDKR